MLETIDMQYVLSILGSSESVETKLINTYETIPYPASKKGLFQKRRPLINALLYEMIQEKKELPSVKEFEEEYLEKYGYNVANEIAERYVVNTAYLSLVRDLHFYFILKESSLFTDVRMEYLYDLYAKTDLLITQDEKKLGLQLYSGNEKDTARKQSEIERLNIITGYRLFLFPLQYVEGKRKQITNLKGKVISLYSEVDARYIMSVLEKEKTTDQREILTGNEYADSFVFPKKKLELTKQNVILGLHNKVNHSILSIGDQLSKQQTEFFQKQGITVFSFEVSSEVLINEGLKKTEIYDGENISPKLLEFLKSYASMNHFNLEQYLIEHEKTNIDIVVAAGAGSGKTHTLVSRIMYLLNMGYVEKLSEIGMITFTNEAADNMRNSLSKRFIKYYKETGNQKYRKYLEDLRSMQIMTIPAFAKFILKEFGHYIGYGNQFDISNLTMERREIIERVANDLTANNQFNLAGFGNFQYHNFIKFISEVWSKLEQKGVSGIQIGDLMKQESTFAQLINKTLIVAEELFEDEKLKQNTLTVSDLTRYLKHLTTIGVPLHQLRDSMKFLFVDEFQDTDNSQIDFIASVAHQSGIKLVVVGDVKQSIYRFRGANSTAFEILKQQLGSKKQIELKTYNLKYNYRTSNVLLDQIEEVFDKWRKKKFLPPQEQRMLSNLPAEDGLTNTFTKNSKRISADAIIKAYQEMIPKKDILGKNINEILAILVRSNSEAEKIGDKLTKYRKKNLCSMPPIQISLDGTLFLSAAAKDLLVLIESWVKFENNEVIYGLSQTAFCPKPQDIKINSDGTNFNNEKSYTFLISKVWKDSINLLKYNPVHLVLNEFLASVQYENNLKEQGLEKHEVRKYQLNLYKILGLMYAKLGDGNTDLLSIYQWLSIMVSTNREEDEAELQSEDFDQNYIKVMTVHKSKGLEFHTVIIPSVWSSFVKEDSDEKSVSDVMVKINDNDIEYGWKTRVVTSNKVEFENETTNYSTLKRLDNYEAIQEETRILYVAMTRAKQRLLIFGCQKPSTEINSWNDLLGI